MLIRWKGLAVAALAVLAASAAYAQDNYPSRPVLLTHGFAAGGNSDTISRVVAEPLAARLGQPVIVEARAGAGGNIASDRLAKAPADGYTLITFTGGHAVSGAMYKSLPYDSVNDFQMISTLIFFPFVIAVRKESPYQTLAELIAAAKAKPQTLTFSSAGVGSTQHLAGELFSAMAGIQMIHVPYRGGQGPITDLLGGQVDVLFDTQTVTLAAYRVRARSAASASPARRRGRACPAFRRWRSRCPAMTCARGWALPRRKGCRLPITERLNREIRAVLAGPPAKPKLEALGNEVRASSPEEMRDWLAAEVAKWKKVVADAKIPQH